ncbi:MAG TPA: helix-turn-helix domain-containing protein [Sphingomicrobium sp.]|nr:helix-turn-helix domain-containing protein [Sphingomicrobium sp.]
MSISDARGDAGKKRPYRLGRRAGAKAETRRRIAEAAVELHRSLGPARTSVAQIAERAGVQRHTYYAHFPDERQLIDACSGLALERDSLPDVEKWAAIAAGRERLRHGLSELYSWYARNEELTSSVLRDAEIHEPTREAVEMRMAPTFRRASQLLCEGLPESLRPLVSVALDFACWRVLGRTHGPDDAARLMSEAIS